MVKRRARRLLQLFGWRHAPAPAPGTPTSFAVPTDAIYARSDVVFEVPLAMCRYSYRFSYGPEGWNPFVQTLLEYAAGKHTVYEGSILNRYYENFQPRTTLELFFDHVDFAGADRHTRLDEFPLGTWVAVCPWHPRVFRVRGEKGLDASHGSQGYGPVSMVKGRLEFSRLTRTYESIRRDGYRPTGGPDGEIAGYFLRRARDYRFVVRAGFHRMAALAALRRDPVRVAFFPRYPRIIELADLENWPQVKGGVVDARIAEAMFLTFFEDDGRATARQLGLA